MPKGSTPWSTRTVAEGGTDSPVGDLVPVPDSAQPVIDAGFIDESGKWRLSAAAADSAFTLSNQNEAVGAGATMFIDPLNMLEHDILILGLLDSSGNNINVDIRYMTNGAAPEGSPYSASFFSEGVATLEWTINQVNSAASDTFFAILNDLNETLLTSWRFFKMIGAKGTVGNMHIRSNEGGNAGTLSAAWLRLP
tara:strand:+ start:57 stop:641 length:585 start_codon:yes stop_codon:yes gene_type:complete